MMERDRAQKRAESLEKTIQNHTLFLKKGGRSVPEKVSEHFSPEKYSPGPGD
jgi:hypothetical protein